MLGLGNWRLPQEICTQSRNRLEESDFRLQTTPSAPNLNLNLGCKNLDLNCKNLDLSCRRQKKFQIQLLKNHYVVPIISTQ